MSRYTARSSIWGFTASEFDPCIFISKRRNLTIAIYVDDILAIGSQHACDEFASELNQKFRIVNQGPVSSFLGINVQRKDSLILLNQIGYIEKLAQRFNIDSTIAVATPLEHSLPLVKPNAHDRRADPTQYKEIIGSLNHLAIFTRPDISLAVSKLSQFNQDPTLQHLNAARRILKYAVSTKHYTLKYGGANTIIIDGYADADWGSDPTERKSTTGYVFTINGGHISWTSKKQTTVALSTMEAQYMSLSDASRELIAHLTFFTSINITIPQPIIYTDNEAPESIVKREPEYQRSKHIDIRYHFVRDHYEKQTFEVMHISTNEQIADILTKPLTRAKHHQIVHTMRLD
jgi:Reverse transcriptase (RNA-dependent DNA polymerase)